MESILTLNIDSTRLSQNFKLLQHKLNEYDQRLLSLQSCTSSLNSTLTQTLSDLTQKYDTLQPKVFKSTQHKITNSINFYVSSQIKEYFEANRRQPQQTDMEEKVMRRINQMKAALKAELVHENQELLKAELREWRKRDKKKEKEDKEKKLYYGQTTLANSAAGTIDPEISDKLDSLLNTYDQLAIQSKRNRESLNSLQLKTYQNNSTLTIHLQQLGQQIRQYKKFVVDNSQNLKMQLARLKTSVMIPLQSKKPMSQQAVLAGFSQLRQNLAKTLTKTQFQSLYSKQVWNEITAMKEQLESLKKEVGSHQEKRRYLGHITEGIEKYEEFISDSFEKVYEKQENVRQAFAMKLEEFSKTLYQLREAQSGLEKHQYLFGEETGQHINTLTQRCTTLQHHKSLHNQQIANISRSLTEAKKDIDNSNYSMKHMADEFDRKVAQTVFQLKQQMNGLKTDFDNLYAAQAKKAEINELWKFVNVLQTKLSMYKAEADQVFHMNKKSWMLAETEVLKGKAPLEKFASTTVFPRRVVQFKPGQITLRTSKLHPREDSI